MKNSNDTRYNVWRISRAHVTLTFAQPAGVVVETGGDLSYGSIILREIGLPAITNVRGVTQVIQTGDELVLQAGTGRVERIGVRGNLMHGPT